MSIETTLSIPTINQNKTPIIQKILVVLMMMSIMAGTLTAVMTYMNVGFSETFLTNWLVSFFSSFLIMPLGFFMMGIMTKLMEGLLPNIKAIHRNLLVGVSMACVMESLMAFTTAINHVGFTNKDQFFSNWFDGFLAALPFGLALMIIISMTIKPKLELFLKS